MPKCFVQISPTKAMSLVLRAKPIAAISLLIAVASFTPPLNSHAQRAHGPVNVSGITTNSSQKGTVVSIAGDGSLSQAQTWQDSEGFHVSVPNAAMLESIKSGKGVKVRPVGTSVEIVVQTKPGASVNVETAGNRLNLSIDGKLESRAGEPGGESQSLVSGPSPYSGNDASSQVAQNSNNLLYQPSFTPRNSGDTGLPTAGRNGFVSSSAQVSAANQTPGTEQPIADGSPQLAEEDNGFLASIFSGTGVLVVLALGLFGLLVSRKLHSRAADDSELVAGTQPEFAPAENRFSSESEDAQSTSLVRTGGANSMTAASRERKAVVRVPVSTPASLFGAYRIDQEVGKLIMGQPHRMDVLSSRAPDDRRAIETSLIKVIASPEDESARRRAREALEEYGFVARQCAALLMAPDAFERTSAARSLGEIKSADALPFLLEGLYDQESIVRNQAVISIGELKVPAAIGALLDMARRHPDVPSSLVSRALSSCSVEGLDFFDAIMPEPVVLSTDHSPTLAHEITRLEPATTVEDLPESSPDERFVEALAKCESFEVDERAAGVKELAQYQVQTSVVALSHVARCDHEPNVRALAVSSLASINHESVFPAILIGMADESREVRAAAARSLSRLSFDRADAYVRVMETADEELLPDVARACLKAGIVSQNIDRLSSHDRRQAYEAFSVICLLAKAKMTDSILEAISDHANTEVRMMAIHLLATTGQPEVFEQFRQLAVKDGVSEDVKTALLEAMYKIEQAKLEQAKPKDAVTPEVMWVSNELEAEELDEAEVAEQEVVQSAPEGEADFEIEPALDEPEF